MARTLTIPEGMPDTIQQGITGVRFEIPHIRNIADTAMEISKPNVRAWYEVTSYDPAGKVISKATRQMLLPNWAAVFTTDVKAMYAKIEIDAENNGLIYGPGVDEPLE